MHKDKAGFRKLVNMANELGLGSQLNDLEKVGGLKGESEDGLIAKIVKNAYMSEDSASGKFMRNAYDWEDKIFKLARFKKNLDEIRAKKKAGQYADTESIGVLQGGRGGEAPRRKDGLSSSAEFTEAELASAMKDAQWGYVDYGTHFNATLRMLDKSGVMPFLHYSVKSTPMVLKTIMKHPVRFMALQAAMMGSGMSAWLGDNEEENLAKPSWAESGVMPNIFGIKSFSEIAPGWYLNSGRIVPGFRFDGFDKLEFGGGFVRGMLNIAGGKSTLGHSFEGEDDSVGQRVFKRVREMAKSYFPPITFGRYGMSMSEKALSDAVGGSFAPKDYNQDDLGYGEILARGVGIREFNKEKEYKKELNKVKKEYEKLFPAKAKNAQGLSKEQEKRNEELRKNSTEVAAKKAMLEKKFRLYKDRARKDGVVLDVELLKQDMQKMGKRGFVWESEAL